MLSVVLTATHQVANKPRYATKNGPTDVTIVGVMGVPAANQVTNVRLWPIIATTPASLTWMKSGRLSLAQKQTNKKH